jgi:hypothetical protein
MGTQFVKPKHKVRLHDAVLGDGFLELPQALRAGYDIPRTILRSSGVFILDDVADIYVWIGKDSPRLLRAAATRLAAELETLIPRPSYVQLTYVNEVQPPPPPP